MNEERKPFYKKWWVWAIVIVVLLIIFTGGEESEDEQVETGEQAVEEDAEPDDNNDVIEEEEPAEDEQAESEEETNEEKPAEEKEESYTTPNMNDIMGKSEEEVNSALGEPESREETEFRLAGTEDRVPAVTSFYLESALEIMFIEGTAQRITYTPPKSVPYADVSKLLTELGIDADITFENEFVTRGEAEGIHEVSVSNADGDVNFVYIIVDEKYQ